LGNEKKTKMTRNGFLPRQTGFCLVVCLFDGVECHFQQYFSYNMAVSFIGKLAIYILWEFLFLEYWYMKFPNWQYSLGIFIFIIIQDICITHVFV
jgi:hypothetical protein